VFGDPLPTEFARIQVLANRIVIQSAHGAKLNGFLVDCLADIIPSFVQQHSSLSAFVRTGL
jgi:hypothetical protein